MLLGIYVLAYGNGYKENENSFHEAVGWRIRDGGIMVYPQR